MGYLTDLSKLELAKDGEGTYAAMWPDDKSVQLLTDYFKDMIPDLVNDFHVTTTYSRVPVVKLYKLPKKIDIQLKPNTYAYNRFGQNKEYLVLEVEHPKLTALFNVAMKNGATWDYPDYKAHISLSTDFKGDTRDLPPLPDFKIRLTDYKVDTLKD